MKLFKKNEEILNVFGFRINKVILVSAVGRYLPRPVNQEECHAIFVLRFLHISETCTVECTSQAIHADHFRKMANFRTPGQRRSSVKPANSHPTEKKTNNLRVRVDGLE